MKNNEHSLHLKLSSERS